MLKKLIKYEIKATGRTFLPFFLSLLIFAGITKFFSSLGPQGWDLPAHISMLIYIIIMLGMFAMTFIVMIQRFSKNLLSDEGYLMFTLPTKHWKHIVSKLLASILWIAASTIVAIISIIIIAYKKGLITEIINGLTISYEQLYIYLGTFIYLYTFEALLCILTGLISCILIIYASIAIGHLFNRHRILATFGAFIVFNTISQFYFILIGMIAENIGLSNIHLVPDNLNLKLIIQVVIAYGIFFTGSLSAAYFAITNFILSKRLNLE